MAEAFVQLATDGSGKKIRNISADVVQSDGSIATVHMQVTALADVDGRVLNIEQSTWRAEMLAAALRSNELLEQILEALS